MINPSKFNFIFRVEIHDFHFFFRMKIADTGEKEKKRFGVTRDSQIRTLRLEKMCRGESSTSDITLYIYIFDLTDHTCSIIYQDSPTLPARKPYNRSHPLMS